MEFFNLQFFYVGTCGFTCKNNKYFLGASRLKKIIIQMTCHHPRIFPSFLPFLPPNRQLATRVSYIAELKLQFLTSFYFRYPRSVRWSWKPFPCSSFIDYDCHELEKYFPEGTLYNSLLLAFSFVSKVSLPKLWTLRMSFISRVESTPFLAVFFFFFVS